MALKRGSQTKETKEKKWEYLIVPNARQPCLLRRDTRNAEIATRHTAALRTRAWSLWKSKQSKLD